MAHLTSSFTSNSSVGLNPGNPPRLTLDRLASLPPSVAVPAFDPRSLPISVVHFGPGAFHRAHQAAFFDAINAFDPRWGICGVSLHSAGVRDALEAQDGLYALAILDNQIRHQIIGSLREVLVAQENIERVFARLISADVKIVSATVTEKGYCLKADGTLDVSHADIEHDLAHPATPKSFIGFVAEGLQRRYARGLPPFLLLPCDNLPNNGKRLKSALVAFTASFDPALSAWIAEQLQCPCTMVDSITPATDEALRASVGKAIGVADQWPIQREAFAQWVIEAHQMADAPDWQRVGVDVTIDVSAFERAKLRLLNGPHSTLAYLGSVRGYQTVFEAMQDAGLADFIERLMKQDIVPLLQDRGVEGMDLMAYSDAILKRFRNPAIKHLLSQIAFDGSQKLPIRILAPLSEALAKGADITRFGVPLAAWLRFLRRKVVAGEIINDPLSVELTALAANFNDTVNDVDQALAFRAVFSVELATNPAVISAVKTAYVELLNAAR